MSFFGDIFDTITGAVSSIGDAITSNLPAVAAGGALIASGGLAAPALAGEAATVATAAEAGAGFDAYMAANGITAATADTLAAAVGVDATAAEGTLAKIVGTDAASTAGIGLSDIAGGVKTAASIASPVLSIAGSAAKLSAVKNMNNIQPTATGIVSTLAPSPIQTPGGLITATPQGPVVASAPTPGENTAGNNNLLIIGACVIGIYFLMKKGQ